MTNPFETDSEGKNCPPCNARAEKAIPFIGRYIDESKVTSNSFSSRKSPAYMTFGYVRCQCCLTAFSSKAPDSSALARAYHDADQNTSAEAEYAAATYRGYLEPLLAGLSRRGTCLEIGTGTGAFLAQLRDLGFVDLVGLEPSPAAIAAARPDLRPFIREGVFTGDELPPGSVSLICCFQTLEHVSEPKDLVEKAYRLIEPGSKLTLVTHDYNAIINRALGRKSPIVDIEHMQLFCPQSIKYLLEDTNFVIEHIKTIRNTYPLQYWVSLLPIPATSKRTLIRGMRVGQIAETAIAINVGNILTVATKLR